MSARVRIIGIGNEWRGDDGVGLRVARLLRQSGLVGADILESDGEGGRLMDAWEGAETVILVDAVQGGGEPGTIYRFEVGATALPASLNLASSHAFGVTQAIELGRALGNLPCRLVFYGIEVQEMGNGQTLSPKVKQAAQQVWAQIRQEVTRFGSESPAGTGRSRR